MGVRKLRERVKAIAIWAPQRHVGLYLAGIKYPINQATPRVTRATYARQREKGKRPRIHLCHLFAAPGNLYLPHQRYYLGRRFAAPARNKLRGAFPYGRWRSPAAHVRLVGNPSPVQVYPPVHCECQAGKAPPDIYSLQSTRCSYFNILSLPLTNAKRETGGRATVVEKGEAQGG